jgi:hypothetical protein
MSGSTRPSLSWNKCANVQTGKDKRVVDMHYEVRIQAVISFHGSVFGEKVIKTEARTMSLTEEQYLQVNKENEYAFFFH